LDASPTTQAQAEPKPPNVFATKAGVVLPVKVSELREKLSCKAKQEPNFRFYALYDRIYRFDVLLAAWMLVINNKGAPGVDGVSCQAVVDAAGGPLALIKELQEELRTKSYKPQAVLRVYIPKPDGRLRPLGIPTVRDRIVQTATLLVIEPIFEADFLDSSFGFRPGRNAHQAIDEIRRQLQAGLKEVYDADLKSYFDTIPHDQLMKALKVRIADGTVLKLIQMWLSCPVIETDDRGRAIRTRPTQGTPQGGVISPLLANLYLHWFEKAFNFVSGPGTWAKARLVRYADDFVILARYQTKRLANWIEGLLEGRFKLTVNREKTRTIDLKETGAGLSFLGFTLRYDRDLYGGSHRYLNVFPSEKAMARARAKIQELTASKRNFIPVEELVSEVSSWLSSWAGYFRHGYPKKAFSKVNWYAMTRLIRHLRRRSQRPYRLPEGKSFYAHLQDLGFRPLQVRTSNG
jgi:RNA-directed DNA polymerase